MASKDMSVVVSCVTPVSNTGNAIVETLLSNTHDFDVIVMGSIELVKVKQKGNQKFALGSVSQSVAKRCKGHACIVKNFSAI